MIYGTEIQKAFYSRLESDKIKINWNKNPIEMKLFLSFLTVEVERSKSHLGDYTGWTKLFNKSCNLEIGGGIVGGVEYLDRLQYGEKLSNPYNNYVNPFYMFDILTDEGKRFFLEYYSKDIEKIKTDISNKIESLENELRKTKETKENILEEIYSIRPKK